MSGSLSALISTACLMYIVNLSAVAIVMPYVCDRIGTVTRARMRAIRLLINMRMLTLVQGLAHFSMTAASCDQVAHHALALAPIVLQWQRCCRCNISSSSGHARPISAAYGGGLMYAGLVLALTSSCLSLYSISLYSP